MRKRCCTRRQYGVSDAIGKVYPIPARMKKLAETSIILRLKVPAICQILNDHLSTHFLCSLFVLFHYYYKEIFIRENLTQTPKSQDLGQAQLEISPALSRWLIILSMREQ